MKPPIRQSISLDTRAGLTKVWTALSDTDRMNRIVGLDLHFELIPALTGRAERRGKTRQFGITLSWYEEPARFEAPRHYLLARRFDKGPLARSESELRLTERADGGTDIWLEHRFWPRSRLWELMVQVHSALNVRPQFQKALDALVRALEDDTELPDAPPPLTPDAEILLANGLKTLDNPQFAAHLARRVRLAPLTAQQRLKPLQLARVWDMPPQTVTAGLLQAVHANVLDLSWEVICPSCRLPTVTTRTLDLASSNQHCGACDVRYDASLADAIALTFRPSGQIRSDLGKIDCLSSPARMPHIVAQIVIEAREEVAWTLDLVPGNYHVRGWPQLDRVTLTVRPEVDRHALTILAGPKALTPPSLWLGPGRATLRIRSKLDEPLTLVLERAEFEPDTLTVGQVLEWPEATRWLPSDALEQGLHVAPWTGTVIAVQVLRGGEVSEQAVGEFLRQNHARALQISTGWVLATLPDPQDVANVAEQLSGALWLTAALTHGTMLELTAGVQTLVSGALLHALVARAHDAEPGHVLLIAPSPLGLPHSPDRTLVELTPGQYLWTLQKRQFLPLPLPTRPLQPVQRGDVVDGRFVLENLLGQGGFGVVHAATDRHSQQKVVIKLLRHELAEDPAQVQRFFDEGRLASRLRGEHAVRIHEWGLADDGRLFLAMERLDGRELSDVLKELGTIDPLRAVRLCQGALAGLAEAHAQGLVHRDVKPANLFLIHEDKPDETVKVIDYGIALDLTGRVGAGHVPGDIVGTPMYMAPEQVTGKPLDGRCDLYAIAIVLYQCLSGKLPFTAENAIGLLMARLTQTPRPIAEVSAQPLPDGLAQILQRALEMDPDDRPRTADVMASALAEVQLMAGDNEAWKRSWRTHSLVGPLDPRIADIEDMATQIPEP